MPCHGQRSESPQVTSIFERGQAERDDDKQNSFLMDMPAEEERRVATECHGANERLPTGLEEQLYQT